VSETRPTRVLLVDDVPLMRSGIAAILSTTPDIVVAAEVDDGDEVIDAVHAHRPDVILLDIRMARQGGIETIGQVKALPHSPKVLMLTTFDADRLAYRSIEAGADGFLLKTASPQEICDGIRNVASGLGAVSPKTASQLFERLRDDADGARREEARRLVAALTQREREVLVGIAEGLTNAEIARRLYVGETTVKTYVTAVFDKLGCDNRASAAVIAERAALL
jgi:DNA-binding NarL/FixJ family response regulator